MDALVVLSLLPVAHLVGVILGSLFLFKVHFVVFEAHTIPLIVRHLLFTVHRRSLIGSPRCPTISFNPSNVLIVLHFLEVGKIFEWVLRRASHNTLMVLDQ